MMLLLPDHHVLWILSCEELSSPRLLIPLVLNVDGQGIDRRLFSCHLGLPSSFLGFVELVEVGSVDDVALLLLPFLEPSELHPQI